MLNISKKNPITENIEQFSSVNNLKLRPHFKILNRSSFYSGTFYFLFAVDTKHIRFRRGNYFKT
jgi:hypothetical protein